MQKFPAPKLRDLVAANQLIHRVRLCQKLGPEFKSIPVHELTAMGHSDASDGNAKNNGTQGWNLASFTSTRVWSGEVFSIAGCRPCLGLLSTARC